VATIDMGLKQGVGVLGNVKGIMVARVCVCLCACLGLYVHIIARMWM